MFTGKTFSDIHYELFSLNAFRKMTIVQLRRILLLENMVFTKISEFKPDELLMEEQNTAPSVVYAHSLRFLCHYHLRNSWQCRDSLRDIQLTINRSNYKSTKAKYIPNNILGICFKILGDIKSARQAFMQSIAFYPDKDQNVAFQMLSLIS